ncbi:hypothetical protein J8273_0525 [Carpediemonas membranifera]|uniref:Uncharacterized protein n=1 Tax=Carpediemonas membranifera TaxID=201153 RepID=A0A8J6AUT4_9EUKA|nr:hypothetical protein J8273_0525 [Carpediemonas membranifera]|eukprot:KAG9395296.1 hypothetical protein J8273_0525 [Carpediemonas membranifera]
MPHGRTVAPLWDLEYPVIVINSSAIASNDSSGMGERSTVSVVAATDALPGVSRRAGRIRTVNTSCRTWKKPLQVGCRLGPLERKAAAAALSEMLKGTGFQVQTAIVYDKGKLTKMTRGKATAWADLVDSEILPENYSPRLIFNMDKASIKATHTRTRLSSSFMTTMSVARAWRSRPTPPRQRSSSRSRWL